MSQEDISFDFKINASSIGCQGQLFECSGKIKERMVELGKKIPKQYKQRYKTEVLEHASDEIKAGILGADAQGYCFLWHHNIF